MEEPKSLDNLFKEKYSAFQITNGDMLGRGRSSKISGRMGNNG
jgi:hypothetical protein